MLLGTFERGRVNEARFCHLESFCPWFTYLVYFASYLYGSLPFALLLQKGC